MMKYINPVKEEYEHDCVYYGEYEEDEDSRDNPQLIFIIFWAYYPI